MTRMLNDSIDKSQKILCSALDSQPNGLDAWPNGLTSWPNGQWHQDLANALRDPKILLNHLQLQNHDVLSEAAAKDFPFRVPWHYANLMKVGDPLDPLLRQVLPITEEVTLAAPHYIRDPLAESQFTQHPSLIQKYQGRVLVVTTGACAVHCRYCFRRHFPYGDHRLTDHHWQNILTSLAQDTSIHEVILSGGDPLALNTEILADWTAELVRLPHIRRLRIHTRLPVVLPQRVDADLLAWLAGFPLPVVMVIHCNHGQEVSPELGQATKMLKRANVTLLNQAVLLNGVNNNLTALKHLSEALFEVGVLPYYLHALDPVLGAQHFDCTDSQAVALIQQLADTLPGYMVPKLVREIPNESRKIPLHSSRAN